MPSSAPRFSIITCFYNSAGRLDRYFHALARLDVRGQDVEFVLVDNASTDDTARLLEMRIPRLPGPARVLLQPKAGLMHARCAGVAAARGDFVLFLDDDNEPDPSYLRELSRLIARYPDAAMFTGNCVLPDGYDVEGAEGALSLLAIRDLPGEFAFPLDTLLPPHGPWGAGLFARRDALAAACEAWTRGEVGIAGRTGSRLTGGEDIWLSHFLTRHGAPVVFSSALRMVHRVAPGRLRPSYLAQLALENGLGHPRLVDAVRVFKPGLQHRAFTTFYVVSQAFLKLPLAILRFLVRRNATALAGAAAQAGYVVALLERGVRRR